jgi:hypothetical protein
MASDEPTESERPMAQHTVARWMRGGVDQWNPNSSKDIEKCSQ